MRADYLRRELIGRWLLIALTSWAMTLSFACTTADRNAKRLRIAVVPMGTTDEYWKTIHAGAVKAGRELDADILWQGPIRRDDRSSQCDVVESMIVRKVSGIVLAPVDDMALRGPVEDAYRNKIPVVIIDSDLKSDKYVSFIATNNYQSGHMGGTKLAELIQGRGKVVMLRGVEGNASTDNRERGFLEAVKKFPQIKVVSENQHGGGTSESAYKASENLLAPFRTRDRGLSIDGIFCPNESTTFGMLRALQDGGLAGKVRFVGFDSSTKLNFALSKGEIDGLVVQSPFKMGYLGVKALVDHLRGKEVLPKVDSGATLITRDSMNRPDMHELLEPDLSKWLN